MAGGVMHLDDYMDAQQALDVIDAVEQARNTLVRMLKPGMSVDITIRAEDYVGVVFANRGEMV